MRKTYRVSERHLIKDDNVVVGLKFDGRAEVVEAKLDELPAVLKAEGLRNRMPRAVTINGKKGGAFPCLITKTQAAAAYLSGSCKYHVDTGDGISFATQAAAGKMWKALKDLGVSTEELVFEWRIGSKVSPMAEKPKQREFKLTEEVEESPFI